MELNSAIIEALSWRLVTETVRRAPKRLRIFESHPGGGMYDCLALHTFDGEAVAYLNRVGRFTPFAVLDDNGGVRPTDGEPWDVWREAGRGLDSVGLVDGICERIGLPIPTKLPPSTPDVLVYRFITEFLAWTPFHRSGWQCRSGFLDDGYGGVQEPCFDVFPAAKRRQLVVDKELDVYDKPAFRFWFILRDSEPVLCLEITGTVWNLEGKEFSLPKAYADCRRIWPIISEIAGDLLP